VIVLVCGGRTFSDRELVFETLVEIHKLIRIELVIHGDARGADSLADAWAISRCVPRSRHPARWLEHGRGAGHLRNEKMLRELLSMSRYAGCLVVAFPGGPELAVWYSSPSALALR
jgi:hypothetical protein